MVQNEQVQKSQFPLVTWQIIAHTAVCTQVLRVNDVFGFWFLLFFFFLFFFFNYFLKLKVVKDAVARLAQHFVLNAHLSS